MNSEPGGGSALIRLELSTFPCAGNCGRQVELELDGVWPPAASYCDACAEERHAREASIEWAERLAASQIPEGYRGFDLQRTVSRSPGESDRAFVERVEELGKVMGAMQERSHLVLTLKRWLRDPRPRSSLWLKGPTGVGKTLFACALGQEVLRAGESVMFLPEPEFFGLLAVEWAGPRPQMGVLHQARGCDLLVLDGANAAPHRREMPRPWMARALFQLVSSRSNACRPIVWTSLDSIDAYAAVWESTGPSDCQGLGGRIYHACGRTELELRGLNWREVGWKRDS